MDEEAGMSDKTSTSEQVTFLTVVIMVTLAIIAWGIHHEADETRQHVTAVCTQQKGASE